MESVWHYLKWLHAQRLFHALDDKFIRHHQLKPILFYVRALRLGIRLNFLHLLSVVRKTILPRDNACSIFHRALQIFFPRQPFKM
jgi:hypothetical protein